jgi:hypothetical protein
MSNAERDQQNSPEAVEAELQRNPQVLLRLAENALTVAKSLRDNYFKNTARFVSEVRRSIHQAKVGQRTNPVLETVRLDGISWSELQGDLVSFIDGGVGRVEIASQVPILLRVGSYCVKTGERQLREREHFGYYPVILGDLQGGSKERKDFIDIVRITAELLGGLSALARHPDLHVLMFHGPLVYLVGTYIGHTPFTEADIDLFLKSYGQDQDAANSLKEDFLREARLDIYPAMTPERADEWSRRRVFEPIAWIAFLFRRLIREARRRNPPTVVAGVVERGELREFVETVLLDRVFRGLREKGNADHFNKVFGRTDLTSPATFLDRLGYNDPLLLSMILRPGERTESWNISKYRGLRRAEVTLPGDSVRTVVNFAPLQAGNFGFPAVQGCYVHVSGTTQPIRIETFKDLGDEQIHGAARRAYLYSRLLPRYGFPVGLDIVDKYAHVPAWMTGAYSKLIKHHLGVSLQRGEINDTDMRRLLVQAMYMSQRDWIYRPDP